MQKPICDFRFIHIVEENHGATVRQDGFCANPKLVSHVCNLKTLATCPCKQRLHYPKLIPRNQIIRLNPFAS